MQLHELKRDTPYKREKRVGRGGKRGKTSGRGTKGQKARAGHSIMPAIREQLKKLPKRRGYKMPSVQAKALVVNVGELDRAFQSGDIVDRNVIIARNLIRSSLGAKLPIKILGNGNISKKLTIVGCAVSASARAKIEAVGGMIKENN